MEERSLCWGRSTEERDRIMDTSRTRNVAIVLYDGVEILDFAGPYEVFAAAAHSEGHPFEVFTIADHTDLITSNAGLQLKPHHSFADHPPVDIIIVPGGGFSPDKPANQRLIQWVRDHDASTELVTSVCTGAFALAGAGVLDGRQATTHWGSIDRMREGYPAIEVVEHARFVDTGHVVTAAGVSAGIDMALHLIERLCGRDLAERVAHYMEYDAKSREAAGV